MFSIVVSLKQRDSQIQFKEDASNAPNVTGLTPSQFQDHLGCPVVSGGDDGRVMFMVKGCRSKVNQPDLGTLDLFDRLFLVFPAAVTVDAGFDALCTFKQNVLWFEVCVS